jgi:hypothetical protein
MYFRYIPRIVNWTIVVLLFIFNRRSDYIGTDEKVIEENQEKIMKQLGKKYPNLNKVLTVIKIAISHTIIILTFVLFMVVLGFERDSIMNFISIVLVVYLLLVFLNSGLKSMIN